MNYKEIDGDLIVLAKQGLFEVVAHGCNCFCTMGAGLAPQMAEAFGCDEYPLESPMRRGDVDKLGRIDFQKVFVNTTDGRVMGAYAPPKPSYLRDLYVVNCYSQYGFGKNHKEGSVAPLDYEALTLCLRKMNHEFEGKHIGLPKIGTHLAGGDWEVVKKIIQTEFTKCDVTVVNYKPKT
jgi:O-acetyl-ADP-ribose deacetylase (regulator of RNase III)